jgi:sulfite reductase (ferredoxin)
LEPTGEYSVTNQRQQSDLERVKLESNGLGAPIDTELGHPAPSFGHDAEQVLKSHGIYQQDNRDLRADAKKAGTNPEYHFMVRCKFPGGRVTADQYLQCDALTRYHGQNELRVTSRQALQYYGVTKNDLRPLLNAVTNLVHTTTLGAAGDVVRNVTVSPVADIDPRYADFGESLCQLAQDISEHFCPQTPRYHELWVDDKNVTLNEDGALFFEDRKTDTPVRETLYGAAYLPRKFKIAIATDFDNSVDVFTNDLGLIACTEDGKLTGFETVVGGGLGFSLRSDKTYPRLASPVAFLQLEEIGPYIEAVVKVFRDFGDRGDRNHARLKYLVQEWGIETFIAKVEEYAGRSFAPARGVSVSAQPHHLGWTPQAAGLSYVGLWLENGRIRDLEDGRHYKSALREIVQRLSPAVRFTPHQNIILANLKDDDQETILEILEAHGIKDPFGPNALRRFEIACPAFPNCPKAFAEAERFLPDLLSADNLLHDEEIHIRVSGCPNGCSRPRTAEIGIIGAGKKKYALFTGGSPAGTRLNQLLQDGVNVSEVKPTLSRLLHSWQEERLENEAFGDWTYRLGVQELQQKLN